MKTSKIMSIFARIFYMKILKITSNHVHVFHELLTPALIFGDPSSFVPVVDCNPNPSFMGPSKFTFFRQVRNSMLYIVVI